MIYKIWKILNCITVFLFLLHGDRRIIGYLKYLSLPFTNNGVCNQQVHLFSRSYFYSPSVMSFVCLLPSLGAVEFFSVSTPFKPQRTPWFSRGWMGCVLLRPLPAPLHLLGCFTEAKTAFVKHLALLPWALHFPVSKGSRGERPPSLYKTAFFSIPP